jgi:rubrerythrin
MTDVRSVIETLGQAIANERKTQDFYLKAASRVLDESGRRMFQELAEEETAHLRVLHTEHESLCAGQGWCSLPDRASLADVDLTPLRFKRSELEGRVRESSSDLDALIIAAEMENDSFVFYVEQFNAAADPLAKALYGDLINSERSHFETVMSNWEHLVYAGRYMPDAASPMEDST